ncbi:MAG: hypothetical protein ACD_67C00063G0001 [uncultured bacterium]|nr:MAG: hypothetical protein ACD_67C00063G0001 [uncultured bacterium]
MKKTLTTFLLATLFLALGTSDSAKAFDQENMQGDPMSNANHFVWSVFAQLQTPDDVDCPTVATSALESDGIPAEQAASIAVMACGNLSQMRTQMESGMNGGEGESMETNLFEAPNWHEVQNLYFQHSTNGTPDGRIAFSMPIDFMSFNFMQFMNSFGQNMETSEGRIALNADVVGGFANYGATLTMYNVPEFDDPIILVDGKEDKGEVVSNLAYDKNARTLTFSAKHFTSFEAVESSSIETKPKITKYTMTRNGDFLKLTISGKQFKYKTKVFLGGRKAVKITRKSNKKIVATFSVAKLRETNKQKFILRAINPNGKETKYKNKLVLDLK